MQRFSCTSLLDTNQRSDAMKGIHYVEQGNPNSFTSNEGPIAFPNDTVIFAIRNYLRDFEQATTVYHDKLLEEFKKQPTQRVLVKAFEKSLK
jgi:hypothetical protein